MLALRKITGAILVLVAFGVITGATALLMAHKGSPMSKIEMVVWMAVVYIIQMTLFLAIIIALTN